MGQTARPEGGGERDEQLRGGGERDEREGERGERNEREGAGSEEDGTNVRGDEEPTERTTVGGRQEDGRDRRLPDGGSCFGNGSRRASFFVFSDDDIVLSSTVECTERAERDKREGEENGTNVRGRGGERNEREGGGGRNERP